MSDETPPFTVAPGEMEPAREALAAADEALGAVRAEHAAGRFPLLDVPHAVDDLGPAADAAKAFLKDTSDIVLLGTGGSSLGAQALAALRPRGATPRMHFFANLDAATWEESFASFDLKTTRFLSVSKSGATPETLMQTIAAADAIERAGGGKYLKHHFLAVSELKESPLVHFAGQIGCPLLPHPKDIGGRFSVLTVAGLLPAMLMGLDAESVRAGAREMTAPVLGGAAAAHIPAAEGAARHWTLLKAGRLNESVLWCYADRLERFGAWWRQLWGESLGKNGQGTTPVAVQGPVDQHSQLQLFLDGPGFAHFTIVTTDTAERGPRVPASRADALGVGYLGGHAMGDLAAAEARATAETLARRDRPVRRIHVPKIDERAMGALFMHFMLETVLMGRMTGVDPFGQPAVDEGKRLARSYLEGGRA